jgi:hypothetical protein
MANPTKDKFGVPIDEANKKAGILMPKLKYRFRVNFLSPFAGSQNSTSLTQNVQSVTRPSVSVDEVEVHSFNSKIYVQGKHTWQTVDVVIRDDITNSVAKLVGAQVQRQVNHYQQTTAASSNDFKFDTDIEVLDGTEISKPTEFWRLEGCFIQNVTYGDHDYSAAESQIVTLTLRFDNATHEAGTNNVNGRAGNESPFTAAATGLVTTSPAG